MDARRPARDRVQAICSVVGTRCRTGPLAFVMARTRRYSIEIRNTPYAGATEAWEVGAAVGNVKNNRPERMERVGLL
jgi:hypothetical protein